jgi:site-specific recombinase XerD
LWCFFIEKEGFSINYVVLDNIAKFYSTMNIQHNIERYGKLAWITEKITPHQLKHSITTHFLNNGMDIRRIQHFLGHRSLASTMIYASITND